MRRKAVGTYKIEETQEKVTAYINDGISLIISKEFYTEEELQKRVQEWIHEVEAYGFIEKGGNQ